MTMLAIHIPNRSVEKSFMQYTMLPSGNSLSALPGCPRPLIHAKRLCGFCHWCYL